LNYIRINLSENGGFVYGEITPIYQGKTHGPRIDVERRATKKLIELTKADFPETMLEITEDGFIGKKWE